MKSENKTIPRNIFTLTLAVACERTFNGNLVEERWKLALSIVYKRYNQRNEYSYYGFDFVVVVAQLLWYIDSFGISEIVTSVLHVQTTRKFSFLLMTLPVCYCCYFCLCHKCWILTTFLCIVWFIAKIRINIKSEKHERTSLPLPIFQPPVFIGVCVCSNETEFTVKWFRFIFPSQNIRLFYTNRIKKYKSINSFYVP